MNVRTDYEYIVVGLGGIGSAAAYRLARQHGAAVLGLEQFELGHSRGASQDHSRIIRLSYHTPGYVRLAQAAYRAWAEVERAADEQLIVRTGGLDLEPPGSRMPIDDYIASLQACDVPFELLDAAELMRRWPQFRVADGTRGLFQPDGGIAAAARGNAAHQRLARAHGATLLDHSPVTGIRPTGGEIEVATATQRYRCRRLILAADAWTNDLLASLGMRLPLSVTQEQVTYFTPAQPALFTPERFPIWIWMDEPAFYGFPIFGEPAVKVGQDVGGRVVTAQTRDFEPDPAYQARVEDFLAQHIPGARGPALLTRTCLYTMPPDRDFIIDRLPGHVGIVLAQGAAHAYKYAAVLGEILCDLATTGGSKHDLAGFGYGRFVAV